MSAISRFTFILFLSLSAALVSCFDSEESEGSSNSQSNEEGKPPKEQTSEPTDPLQQVDTLAALRQMEGLWYTSTNQWEHWTYVDSTNSFVGEGYDLDTLTGEKKVFENLVMKSNPWRMIALVDGQNEGASIAFVLDTIRDGYLSFGNATHDFPQRLTYEYSDRDHAHVQVLATGGRGFEMDYVRKE